MLTPDGYQNAAELTIERSVTDPFFSGNDVAMPDRFPADESSYIRRGRRTRAVHGEPLCSSTTPQQQTHKRRQLRLTIVHQCRNEPKCSASLCNGNAFSPVFQQQMVSDACPLSSREEEKVRVWCNEKGVPRRLQIFLRPGCDGMTRGSFFDLHGGSLSTSWQYFQALFLMTTNRYSLSISVKEVCAHDLTDQPGKLLPQVVVALPAKVPELKYAHVLPLHLFALEAPTSAASRDEPFTRDDDFRIVFDAVLAKIRLNTLGILLLLLTSAGERGGGGFQARAEFRSRS